MIKQFLYTIWKNFKVVFRSWTSIFFIFVGPLSIILLLVLAFSSTGFKSVNIGVYSENASVTSITDSMQYLGTFIEYPDIELCKSDLSKQAVHMCLGFYGYDDKRMIVDMHFDNSREVISLLLMEHIKNTIYSKQRDVVASSTTGIMSDLKNIVLFMKESRQTIDKMISDMENQRSELSRLRNDINKEQQEFKRSVDDFEDVLQETRDKRYDLERDTITPLNELEYELSNVINDMHYIRQIVAPYNIPEANSEIDEKIGYLEVQRNKVRNTRSNLQDDFEDIDDILQDMDEAVYSLRQSEYLFQDIKNQIDNSVDDIKTKISELHVMKNKISSEQAKVEQHASMDVSTLVNPFSLNYQPLFQGSKRVQALADLLTEEQKQKYINFSSLQILLPIIICMIVVFISVIFSNIVVLEETHSPSYLRDLLLPVPDFMFPVALFITSFLITLFQVGIVLFIGHQFFVLDILENLAGISVTLMMLVAIFSLFGMIIGYIVRTETTSLLVCTFFLIANFILSGIVFPIERMSIAMSTLSANIPFTIGLSMLRQSIFYGVGIAQMYDKMIILALNVASLLLILYVARVINRRRSRKS